MRRALIAVLPCLLGCSSLERAAECRAVAEVINRGAAQLDDALRRNPVDMLAVERESNHAAREIRSIAVTDGAIRKASREIADNFTRLGEAAAIQASVLRRAEPNVESTRNWYGIFVSRHAQQVKAMTGHCRGD